MFFSHHLILVWTSTLLSSASIGHASADNMLRGREALEESKAMQEVELKFMLLPPESEDAFILSEVDYANLASMEIGFAPEDSNSTHANGHKNRKLASYTSLEFQMATFVQYERTSRGLQSVYWSADLLDEAQRWADHMASTNNTNPHDGQFPEPLPEALDPASS